MLTLYKYLLTKFTEGGHPDKAVGNQGEIIEYGNDADHAKERAAKKYGGKQSHYMVIGVIQD